MYLEKYLVIYSIWRLSQLYNSGVQQKEEKKQLLKQAVLSNICLFITIIIHIHIKMNAGNVIGNANYIKKNSP